MLKGFRFGNFQLDSAAWALAPMASITQNTNSVDRELFTAPPSTFTLEPDDWNTGFGPGKWRFWEDRVELR